MTGLSRSDDHVYTLDGRNIPSVTQVMGSVLGSHQYATQYHLDRGSANHACYALLAQGVIDEYDIDPDCQPWIDGWRRWAELHQPEIVEVEQSVASRLFWYAGTFDLLARIDGKLTMIDFKNSALPKDAIQLAAYAQAWEEEHKRKGAIKQLMSVQIAGDGKYKIGVLVDTPREMRLAAADWNAVRRVYRIKTGE
jgi:hypothetical protein